MQLMMKIKRTLLASLGILLLSACGGGGGGGGGGVGVGGATLPAGLYAGTLSSTAYGGTAGDVIGVVTSEGSVGIYDTTHSDIFIGTGGGTSSLSGNIYSFDVYDNSVQKFPITGSIASVSGATVKGTYQATNVPSVGGTLNMENDLNTYNQAIDFSTAMGSYVGPETSLFLNADGSFAGDYGGCGIAGELSAIDPSKSEVNVSLTVDCGTASANGSGFGFLASEGTLTYLFLFFEMNGVGTVLLAQK